MNMGELAYPPCSPASDSFPFDAWAVITRTFLASASMITGKSSRLGAARQWALRPIRRLTGDREASKHRPRGMPLPPRDRCTPLGPGNRMPANYRRLCQRHGGRRHGRLLAFILVLARPPP